MRAERRTEDAHRLAEAAWNHLNALNFSLRASKEAAVAEDHGYYRFRTSVPHEFYNGVVCSAPVNDHAPALIASTIESFRAAGSPFMWWPTSFAVAKAWEPLLCGHGLAALHDLPLMALDLAGLRAPEEAQAPYDIRRVEDDEQLLEWSRAFVAGNGWPSAWAEPFARMYRGLITADGEHRCYTLYEHGVPVATSSLFMHEGVPGIYDVATLPAARGRGYGGAITLAPLIPARDEGARIAVLQSSDLGLRVYERIGFQTVGHLSCFNWRPPIDESR